VGTEDRRVPFEDPLVGVPLSQFENMKSFIEEITRALWE
jgi:hypothetical protein